MILCSNRAVGTEIKQTVCLMTPSSRPSAATQNKGPRRDKNQKNIFTSPGAQTSVPSAPERGTATLTSTSSASHMTLWQEDQPQYYHNIATPFDWFWHRGTPYSYINVTSWSFDIFAIITELQSMKSQCWSKNWTSGCILKCFVLFKRNCNALF